MSERSLPRRPAIWELAAVGSAAFAWQLPYFDRWMSLLDEGHIVAFADMLAKGGEVYRDASMLPLPGAFYLLELGFEILGPSVRLARWIVVVEFTLLTVVAFALLRRLVPRGIAWTGAGCLLLYRIWAFPHWHMYSYSTTSLTIVALALLAVVRFLETGNRWVLALAGLATGLGALCKQDYGAVGWIAMNAVVALSAWSSEPRGHRRWRSLAWYNLPIAAVAAITAAHFLHQGLFMEMLRQTVLNHLIGITTFEYTGLPPLLPFFGLEPQFRGPFAFVYAPSILLTLDAARDAVKGVQETLLWDFGIKLAFYGPYLVAAVAAVRMWRARRDLKTPERRIRYLTELLLSLYAIVAIAALNRPVDWVHVAVLYWPFIVLVVVMLHSHLRGRIARVAMAIAVVPVAGLAGCTLWLGWQLRAEFSEPLASDRAGIFVSPDDARLMSEVVDYVQNHSAPGEPFAVLPYYPLISFLADRPAPHRAAYVLWPVSDVPNREAEIMRALDSGPMRHLVYHFTQNIPFPRMEEFAPDLFAYLVDNYEIDRVFSDPSWGYMMAGLRRSDRPKSGVPVFPIDGISKIDVELPSGERRPVPVEKRPKLFQRKDWPFRSVLALRPLSAGRRTVLSAPLDVAEHSHLRTAIGIHPTRWFVHPPSSVTFSISAVVKGQRRVLYSRTLDPHRDATDRGWFDVDVSLEEYGGQRIIIEFATGSEWPSGEQLLMGGWDVPLLSESMAPAEGES